MVHQTAVFTWILYFVLTGTPSFLFNQAKIASHNIFDSKTILLSCSLQFVFFVVMFFFPRVISVESTVQVHYKIKSFQ